ncbi:DUF3108 domain-containing protein [Mesorhizobium amorphae]
MPRPTLVLAALLAGTTMATSAAPAAEAFHGEYTISFLGITVARSSFDSRYEGDKYTIDGSASAAGLALIFDDTTGTLTASGRFSRAGIQPQAFRADYTSGKKVSMVDIRFSGGAVSSSKVLPPPKPRGDDWLPLDAGDLKGVADPIGATVIRAGSLDEVCGRTVKMYDGEMRANLVLTPVSKGKMAVKGYQGPTVTCLMTFQPVSGYAQRRKALKFLRDRSKIMVTFAPLGQTGIYAPIHATVGTEIGTITVKARRFEAKS